MQEFAKPPKIFCGIPVKFVVLLMHVYFLVVEVQFLCFESKSERTTVNLVIMIILTIFTIIGFIFNDKTVMKVHSFLILLFVCGLFIYILYSGCLLIDEQFFNPYSDGVSTRDIYEFMDDLLVFIIVLCYFMMCWILIEALEDVPVLPTYTIHHHASHPTQAPPPTSPVSVLS